MDTARYVIGVLMAVTIPPALAYWFLVHPFIGFWRRLGPRRSYVVLALFFTATLVGGWFVRDALLGRDLGTSVPLAIAGTVLYIGAAIISMRARKQLKFYILAGLPEIRGTGDASALLRTGIYARIRHPRYLSFAIGLLGFSLFANYAGLYLLAALMLPVLWVLILVEERELRLRFGNAYREYERAVPRFIPRFRSNP